MNNFIHTSIYENWLFGPFRVPIKSRNKEVGRPTESGIPSKHRYLVLRTAY